MALILGKNDRDVLIATSTVTALVVPLGPVLGGALADMLSWHWVFFINLPLSLLALHALRYVERPQYLSSKPFSVASHAARSSG